MKACFLSKIVCFLFPTSKVNPGRENILKLAGSLKIPQWPAAIKDGFLLL